MEKTEFKDIETYDKFIEITEDTRLYYKLITYDETYKDKVGFKFVSLECIGWECDGKNEYQFSPTSSVEVIVEGTALFDGVRHLYYGSQKTDNYGYHYYPSLTKIIEVLKNLRELELKYCNATD